MNASRQIPVRVDDEDVSIWVTKSGKSTWRAHGEFRGKHVDAVAQSESGAISAWKSKADYLTKD
ncbi:hypothetical protein [Ralstonia pickettii]|uniref:hypothetical protein n=1 Tax=Ralstonia pickettii TaxID=329 RepID=UPI002D787783|nr:hypothetical protein [Ralstonia pickettii]